MDFVKLKLRELNEPITLFGEGDDERNQRLEMLNIVNKKESKISTVKESDVNTENEENEMTVTESKFEMLKKKMRKIREQNLKEVLYEKKNTDVKKKRKKKRKRNQDEFSKTAEEAEWESYKRRKKEKPQPEGWEIYGDDYKYKTYKKKCRNIPILERENYSLTNQNEMSEEVREKNKERTRIDLLKQMEKRKKFNRRRTFFEDENINFINEGNRNYNRKIELAYGSYTNELKKTLENLNVN